LTIERYELAITTRIGIDRDIDSGEIGHARADEDITILDDECPARARIGVLVVALDDEIRIFYEDRADTSHFEGLVCGSTTVLDREILSLDHEDILIAIEGESFKSNYITN
jgi:hypothetical protein